MRARVSTLVRGPQMLELAARALSPEQRETLRRLVAEKRVMR
jgi:hypothetical protein